MTPIPFKTALKTWLRIAALSFGGPAGQIAVMHRILVDEKKWLSESRFLNALNYCMLLPGPEAQQLMTYCGWMMYGIRGGLTAGLLFVLPGFISIFAMSLLYINYSGLGWVEGLFFGIKTAVVALVLEAAARISRRVLKNKMMLAIAAIAFTSLFLFKIPFPLIILAAAVTGLIGSYLKPLSFWMIHNDTDNTASSSLHTFEPGSFLKHAGKTLAVWLPVWLSPILVTGLIFGFKHILFQQALFFSKVAVVTFGGAYSVLSYVAQVAVQSFHWLTPGEMLDGLGLAESTPGPLIQVVQFVGMLSAFRAHAPLSPILAATLSSLLVTWVIYAPCFMWIFLGAPYIEKFHGNKTMSCVLSSISAAVIGTIINLGTWFALHVLFRELHAFSWMGISAWIPSLESLRPNAAILTIAASFALIRYRVNMGIVLFLCAATGILISLNGGF